MRTLNFVFHRDRTRIIYSIYSRRPSIEVHNELSDIKVNYLIVSRELCQNNRLLNYWDTTEPEYRNETLLCEDLFATRSFNNIFLKVYQSHAYIVVKVYSETINDFSDFNLLPSNFRSK